MKLTRMLWVVTAGVAVLAGVLLSGCSGIIRDFPETRLYVIETPDVDETGAGFQSGRGLMIRQFDIAAEFESSFFVYKVSDNRFTNDYYNKFMVSPGRMITDAVRDALNDSDLFRLVPAGEPDRIDFRLSGKITQLYVDIRNPEHPRAVMALRLLLEKQAPGGFTPVINNVYSTTEPVSGTRSEVYVEAWNKCLAQVVNDFLTDAEPGVTH
jgi:ABC-type uncharacterized transport system auxiliary subunit